MRNFSVLLIAVMALFIPSVSRSADPTPAGTGKDAKLADLPPKVACPMFNMGQWGGSPNMWYAVYCEPDSGATALTLPDGASACACQSECCVGGLSFLKTRSKVVLGLSKGYPGARLDPRREFKTYYVNSSVEDWYVKINVGTPDAPVYRTAKIFRVSAKKQTAEVPLSQFHTPPASSPEAVEYARTHTVPILVEDFRAIVGFEVDGTDVNADDLSEVKYSEKILIRDPDHPEAPVEANAYRVLFNPSKKNSTADPDPILAEVLMKDPNQ